MITRNIIASGQKVVTSHGKAVLLLKEGIKTSAITIKAKHGNAGMIYVGNRKVNSGNGYILDAGEEVTLVINETEVDVYINSDNDNDGISYIYWYNY